MGTTLLGCLITVVMMVVCMVMMGIGIVWSRITASTDIICRIPIELVAVMVVMAVVVIATVAVSMIAVG